jgi:hypothetical protein
MKLPLLYESMHRPRNQMLKTAYGRLTQKAKGRQPNFMPSSSDCLVFLGVSKLNNNHLENCEYAAFLMRQKISLFSID